jgi:cell wall-associated NlpC family hydrolase
VTGAVLIAEARKLVGSAFFHMGRDPATGLDCTGVILMPAQKLGLTRFEPVTYSPGGDGEYLAECLELECVLVEEAMQPGDIALFRIRDRLQHLAYLTGEGTMIHASEKAGVRESVIDERWQERIAGVYRWKALADV